MYSEGQEWQLRVLQSSSALIAEHGETLTDREWACEVPRRQVVDISGIRGNGLREMKG